jgi:hypothetical protein
MKCHVYFHVSPPSTHAPPTRPALPPAGHDSGALEFLIPALRVMAPRPAARGPCPAGGIGPSISPEPTP